MHLCVSGRDNALSLHHVSVTIVIDLVLWPAAAESILARLARLAWPEHLTRNERVHECKPCRAVWDDAYVSNIRGLVDKDPYL